MTKKVLSILLALCLVIGAVPLAALADEPVQVSEFTLASEVDSPSNDELFAGYVDQLFFGNAGISTYADSTHNAGSRLKGDSLELYNGLKEKIIKIAAGDIASTEITVNGVPYSKDTVNAVMDALLSDCPYELFWFDKVSGWLQGGLNGYTMVNFKVATAYSKTGNANTFETDTTKIKSVQTAVANAKKVVEDNKAKSDYEKLVAYKEYICDAVTYNTAAAEGTSNESVDPWQLIYVFDKDTSTNVVCEGYAKAFQYLCDLTSFTDPDIQCYSVSGTMHGGTGAGLHMWNIVTIGKKNYLVDVTNCDEETVGYPNRLFLVGYYSGSAQSGYVIRTGPYTYNDSNGATLTYESTDITYVYDDDSKIFGDVLTLSNTEYTPSSTPEQPTPIPTPDLSDFVIEDGVLIQYKGSGGNVVIPDSVTNISAYAFLIDGGAYYLPYPGVTSITIPASVTTIDSAAFSGMPDLISINVNSSNTAYESKDGVLFKKIDGWEDQYANVLWAYPAGRNATTYTIPEGVTLIRQAAFEDCTKLTSVTIPNSVKDIDWSAFSGCTGLTSITIPDGVKSIGIGAFNGCTSLTSINIPDSVTDIEGNVFSGCTSMTSITVGSGNQNYTSENGVLYTKDKKELVAYPAGKTAASYSILNTVTSIADGAFAGCGSLTSISIPNSVTSIEQQAFKDCTKLTTATIPDGVTMIQNGAFKGCTSLTSVSIPKDITSIESEVFANCSNLTNVTIPDGVTSIDMRAFENCSALTSITIPASVTSIGIAAFSGCDALKNVVYSGTENKWGNIEIADGNFTITDIATKHYDETIDLKLIANKDTVTVPVKGGKPVNVTLTATATDIDNAPVDAKNAAWSVSPATKGISIKTTTGSTNTLTVNPAADAPTGGKVTVTVSFGGKTATKDITITRAPSVATSVAISGKSSITLPKGEKTATEKYTAKVSDQYGVEMKGAAVTWGLGAAYEGVDIDMENGVITVSSNASPGKIVLNAASGEATGSFTITLTRENPFTDVAENSPFKDSILWAVEKGITNGIDVGKFGPNNACTRGQIVTFLWRAAGEPDPKSTNNPFKDVKSSDYFYKAVLWAVQNGITNGTGKDTFSPNATCNRGDAVTFMWRAAKKPTVQKASRFKDVVSGSYYEQAVNWAVENGITFGNSADGFGPKDKCTRGQIVTFLYRGR